MEDLYSKALEVLGKGRICVLAAIIRLTGSGPRAAGTRFLIMEDGSFVGTIGGGRLEAEVIKEAKRVFETSRPGRMHLSLMGKDVAETDMICGGEVDILFEPLFPGDEEQLAVLKRLMEIRKQGGEGLLATVVQLELWEKEKSPKVFLERGGRIIGNLQGMKGVESTLLDRLEQWLDKREPGILVLKTHEGEEAEVFVEPVLSDPLLYVFGGGHVSAQIVPLASKVGFKTVVIDDRAEFADPARFPEAEAVHCHPFQDVFKRFPVDESSYLVIVTRGHLNDKTVLEQSLRSPARYIGMIGSRRKKAMICQRLLEDGFTQRDLDRVFSPIGLDIGAETPEEIAVSIVAELIKVRAGKGAKG